MSNRRPNNYGSLGRHTRNETITPTPRRRRAVTEAFDQESFRRVSDALDVLQQELRGMTRRDPSPPDPPPYTPYEFPSFPSSPNLPPPLLPSFHPSSNPSSPPFFLPPFRHEELVPSPLFQARRSREREQQEKEREQQEAQQEAPRMSSSSPDPFQLPIMQFGSPPTSPLALAQEPAFEPAEPSDAEPLRGFPTMSDNSSATAHSNPTPPPELSETESSHASSNEVPVTLGVDTEPLHALSNPVPPHLPERAHESPRPGSFEDRLIPDDVSDRSISNYPPSYLPPEQPELSDTESYQSSYQSSYEVPIMLDIASVRAFSQPVPPGLPETTHEFLQPDTFEVPIMHDVASLRLHSNVAPVDSLPGSMYPEITHIDETSPASSSTTSMGTMELELLAEELMLPPPDFFNVPPGFNPSLADLHAGLATHYSEVARQYFHLASYHNNHAVTYPRDSHDHSTVYARHSTLSAQFYSLMTRYSHIGAQHRTLGTRYSDDGTQHSTLSTNIESLNLNTNLLNHIPRFAAHADLLASDSVASVRGSNISSPLVMGPPPEDYFVGSHSHYVTPQAPAQSRPATSRLWSADRELHQSPMSPSNQGASANVSMGPVSHNQSQLSSSGAGACSDSHYESLDGSNSPSGGIFASTSSSPIETLPTDESSSPNLSPEPSPISGEETRASQGEMDVRGPELQQDPRATVWLAPLASFVAMPSAAPTGSPPLPGRLEVTNRSQADLVSSDEEVEHGSPSSVEVSEEGLSQSSWEASPEREEMAAPAQGHGNGVHIARGRFAIDGADE